MHCYNNDTSGYFGFKLNEPLKQYRTILLQAVIFVHKHKSTVLNQKLFKLRFHHNNNDNFKLKLT